MGLQCNVGSMFWEGKGQEECEAEVIVETLKRKAKDHPEVPPSQLLQTNLSTVRRTRSCAKPNARAGDSLGDLSLIHISEPTRPY